MTVGDLIEVRDFPAVVQAADVRVLRDAAGNDAGSSDAARDFIAGYLGFDERSRYALSTTVASLTQSGRGGAFFLNGVFGSGKSHLLGLLTLMADGIGHDVFAATQPQLAAALSTPDTSTPVSRFVTYFSLDDYNAAKISLEEIIHLEIAREWHRRFGERLEHPFADSRLEYFAALDEQLIARGCSGLFIFIDELSLFLSAKEHSALQADAAFLQFLGQRAARSTPCPTHVFAAIQKTIDDIGDIEAYSLLQIRDRFQTLPLSLAHLPSLISHRLIAHKNPTVLQSVCRESYDELSAALPRLEFGAKEWETLFPFHPATVTLLENVVSRFFSRTRSAAIFCAWATGHILDAPASTRVLPESIFTYFLPELESHPELRPFAGVWQRWQSDASELANDTTEAQTMLRLMQTLLLFKIAGVAPTAVQLANAMSLDAKLSGDGNYEYARVLLERMLARGSHLAVERRENLSDGGAGGFSDRYTIDQGTRVAELARRHLRNSLSELRPDDARVAAHVLQSCCEEPLPLSMLADERAFAVFWRHAPRHVAVQVLLSAPAPDAIANRAAMLCEPGAREDLLLLIIPPFSRVEVELSPSVYNPRLLIWSPRPPTEDEWQAVREATAAHLLESDPQLLDNRRGRAIVQFLKDESQPRGAQMARLAARLLQEGVLRAGDNRIIEAGELASGQSWQSVLEAIAEFALPQVFPKFESIAPRARVLTPGNAEQLCLEILRRPVEEPYFAPSLERVVRAVAQPLGIADPDKGRWKISGLLKELNREIKEVVGDGSTLGALEAHFSKSDWGLTGEQLSLAICVLLRSGELTAQGFKSELLTPAKIGLPLRRSVHVLRPGQLIESENWAQLQRIVALLTSERLGPLSFSEQQRARLLLLQKRDELAAESELLQARLRQLQRTLNHSPAQWLRAESTLQAMATLLENLGDDGDASHFFESVATLDSAALSSLLSHWRELHEQLESRLAELLGIHRLLTHPRLSTPPELQNARAEILQRLETGEAILEDDEIAKIATNWRAEYSGLYRDWHSAQHDAARWNSIRRLQNSDALRALRSLSTLCSRSFGQYGEIHGAISAELAKQCPRDGALLPGEATCNACDLLLGERVILRDAHEIDALIASAIATFQTAVDEETARTYLSRDEASAPLLQWSGNGDELPPLLTNEVLHALDEAFKPRRRVTRSAAALTAHFSNCRTRSEFESAFQNWLNGEENPAGDDEIALD